MRIEDVTIGSLSVPVYSLNTVVVGTGAAGFNAADSLYDQGEQDIAIITEGIGCGTSRNTGSDKQTYYKLTQSGEVADSVADMAKTLFSGGAMHGDIALAEAALSSRCFYKLVNINVPFPHNRYGEYVGYKTDHDPRQRATSAGPLTSKYMTEQLEKRVKLKGIKIFNRFLVIKVLTETADTGETRSIGLIALNLDKDELGSKGHGITLFNCTNIVYATGGPAAIYDASVYPKSQFGSTGVALSAGVKGVNLTESQYGIASVKFRWNLSGTYQQVLPRYISTNQDMSDEKEFLKDYFEDKGQMLDAIFLKGYQWPFDPRKLDSFGSSIIDILVYNETQLKGRRVFLDYTRNPLTESEKGKLDFSLLSTETYEYLEKSGALFGTPIERLAKMNTPAIELYKANKIDLYKEYLEIDVCAQHCNGGLLGDVWWESNVRHFFPVGEVNGSFGVYRPGGTALNSTQVGSLRAAQFITAKYGEPPMPLEEFISKAGGYSEKTAQIINSLCEKVSHSSNVKEHRKVYQRRMSRCGAIIRSRHDIEAAVEECHKDLLNFYDEIKLESVYEIPEVFRNLDILITQFTMLNSQEEYIKKGGRSRGSYLIQDENGQLPLKNLPEMFRFTLDEGLLQEVVCEVEYSDKTDRKCSFQWNKVREIPKEDQWFENVWNAYREGNCYK